MMLRESLRDVKQAMLPVLLFSNWRDYTRARVRRDDGETVLKTRSGLKIAMRHNRWDAIIIEEQFLRRDYLRRFRPPSDRHPVIVDIGSYIGDFALYCAHKLRARVVAYEPTAENWEVLNKNLSLNPQLAGRLTAVNKGVASTPEIFSNVQVIGREVHASSEWYGDAEDTEQRVFPCDTLTEVLDRHGLNRVDLLKVDCEGGEYDILPSTPNSTYERIGAIVYEWHRVPDWPKKIERLEATLRAAGYTVEREGQLGYATR